MKILAHRALSIGAAALIAGCGGFQSPIGTPGAIPQNHAITTYADRGGSWMLPEAKVGGPPDYKTSPPLLFVTNYTYSNVTVYRAHAKNPAPVATISDELNFPTGDCIDGDGTLYVTNEPINGYGYVSEYPLGQTTASKVITKGIVTPAFCAVDGNGNLWVANYGSNVTEYLHGSKKPHFVITDGLTYPDGIAIDHAGNIYVGNLYPPSSSNVQVYPPGSNSPSRTITDGITWPVGIAIDSSGTLYVANLEQNNVQEYLSGRHHPYQTITKAMHLPAGLILNAKGTLYVANSGDYYYKGYYYSVAEFPSGSTVPSKRWIRKGLHAPESVAYYPPLLP